MKRFYILDNNILIRLANHLPLRSIPSAWGLIERLGDEGRCCIPEAVFAEFLDEDNKGWFLDRSDKLIMPYSQEQVNALVDVATLTGFIQHGKVGQDADQPLVALGIAKSKNAESLIATIVTDERRRKGQETRLRVPDACDHFGLACCNLYDVFEMEGPI